MSRKRTEAFQEPFISSRSQSKRACTTFGFRRSGHARGAAVAARLARSSCNPRLNMEGCARCGGVHSMVILELSRAPLSSLIPCVSCDIEPIETVHVANAFAIEIGAETMSDETVAASAPTVGSARIPPFRALDPELPSLAARAAFQLDNLRLEAQGKIQAEPKQDAIEKFASRLQGALRLQPGADRRSLLDPLTTSILHGAVLQATHDKPNSLDDMLGQIGRLTQQLLEVQGFRGQTDMIVALRDFCLAISDLATSKQYLIRSPRPYHGPKSPRL
jgi:hypothetical protein